MFTWLFYLVIKVTGFWSPEKDKQGNDKSLPAMENIKVAVASIGSISFMNLWNDFLWPLIVTTRPRLRLLTVGLAAFQEAYFTFWHTLMAGTTMVMVPILIVFLFAQRFFVEGITVGAIKG